VLAAAIFMVVREYVITVISNKPQVGVLVLEQVQLCALFHATTIQ